MKVTFSNFFSYTSSLWAYRHLLSSLIKKDFKGRFRNSFFGYLWHLIIPLSHIIIYVIVFTTIFGRDITNYWLYLSVGVFSLNFLTTSINSSANAITSNSDMVSRMYFPREYLVFSSVVSNFITFIISYAIVLVLMLLFGMPVHTCILLVPVCMLLEFIYVVGLGLILSSCNVYMRDVSNAVNAITIAILYVTPIFYTSDIDSGLLQAIIWSHPLTYYVETFHNVMYAGIMVPLEILIVCFIVAIVVFIVGLLIFKKLETGFAERL